MAMKLSQSSDLVRRTIERIWFAEPAARTIPSLPEKKRQNLHYLVLSGRTGSSLGIDSLEDRLALTAGIDLPVDPATDSNQIAEISSPDPSTIPVFAGPGDNRVVSITDPTAIVNEPNPADIPVFAGPGDNTVVSITQPTAEPDPSTIPVYAGPGDNTVVEQTPPGSNEVISINPIGQIAPQITSSPIFVPPAAPVLVESAPLPLTEGAAIGNPELSSQSRVATGTMSPSLRTASGASNDALIPVVDGLLMEDGNLTAAVEEILSSLPPELSGVATIDQAVEGDWLFFELRDILSKELVAPENATSPATGYQTANSGCAENIGPEPVLLFQIGSLGLLGAALMATSLIPSKTAPSGGRRRKQPRENLLRAESDDEIEIRTDETSGEAVWGRLRDLSEGGLGVVHRGPLPAKTLSIKINGEEAPRHGTVRWTRRLRGNLFASGIKLDSV